jgi:hypothetical protein
MTHLQLPELHIALNLHLLEAEEAENTFIVSLYAQIFS